MGQPLSACPKTSSCFAVILSLNRALKPEAIYGQVLTPRPLGQFSTIRWAGGKRGGETGEPLRPELPAACATASTPAAGETFRGLKPGETG